MCDREKMRKRWLLTSMERRFGTAMSVDLLALLPWRRCTSEGEPGSEEEREDMGEARAASSLVVDCSLRNVVAWMLLVSTSSSFPLRDTRSEVRKVG